MILESIENFAKLFLEEIKNPIHIISHFDTDGITSAAILCKTLERLNKQFSIKIIKQLTQTEIDLFPKEKTIILLDLGSGSIDLLALKNKIFIIDHHEINKNIPFNVSIINPHLLEEYEELCTAELTYLFSKSISKENKNLSHLAIIGMIGDTMEKEINKTRDKIIKEADVKIKCGLLIYPSTRPLDKTLEYSSRPFIPGVTGDSKGTFELLKEAGIEKTNKNFKTLIDLTEEEMKRLTTSIMLRLSSKEYKDYLGNLYLIKFFNKIEDAREISAIINACSRMGKSEISLMLCLGNLTARKKAERLYMKYRQHIISGLRFIEKNEKIQGRDYVIINAKDKIKDTLIGTLASIISFSQVYKEGTIIIAMAYDEDKIKISARLAGRNKSNQNLKEVIDSIACAIEGESGGHKRAAGCTIKKEYEDKFIELVKKKFEFEVVKI
ncbi:DHH family phosphoesterase [Candidatus Pacearchaeota archaeon]|nr:DHH family phosphoesterase [Candidatus Pacearchaeota archaeon]